jgi:Spy/CpxP family protein refolding chaperone
LLGKTKSFAFTQLYLGPESAQCGAAIFPVNGADVAAARQETGPMTINQPFPGKTRKLLLGAATAFALLAGGAGVTQAYAQHAQHGGWSHDGGPGDGNIPVQKIEARADRMLKRVNATPDQTAKIHAIIEAAATDINPIRKSLSGTRDQMRTLMAAPQIDRAAIETIRSQRATAMDQISQRTTRAMEDAADVLTPAQRQQLATFMADRQAHHKN